MGSWIWSNCEIISLQQHNDFIELFNMEFHVKKKKQVLEHINALQNTMWWFVSIFENREG